MISEQNPEVSDLVEFQLRELDSKVAPLRLAALVMFVLYVATLLSAIFPLQLLDPLWYQNLINTLVNNAVVPLVGLSLLQLLRLIHPDLRPTRELLKSASRLAPAVAIGFLLLVPLQGAVALKVLNRTNADEVGRIEKVSQQIARLQQEIQAADSSGELTAAVPGLPPQIAQQLAERPIGEAREQMLTNLRLNEAKLRPLLIRAQSKRRWAVARETFRNGMSSVALAAAFFALRLRPRTY
jgi:hypothetical protein